MWIQLIAKVLACLPLCLVHALGWCLGWVAYGASASYRQLFRKMLAQAIASNKPLYKQVLYKAIGESGKGLFELPYVWFSDETLVQKKVICNTWSIVDQYQKKQHPLIILTPHMGCFEVAAQAYAQRYPITVLYRPNRKPSVQSMILARRTRPNLQLAATDMSGVRRLLKALQQGQTVGILPDQVPTKGQGVWVDVFGHKAYTMNLPAKLIHQTGAAVLIAVALRLPLGRGWCLEFIEVQQPMPVDNTELTVYLNQAIEKIIVQYPEQYYWAYNRYKIPEIIQASEKK